MANVRDSDTSLWLHNKLGTSYDNWSGGSICSQLNAEVLRNIKDCFPDLQTQVKLKLLLSFFHIPRRNIEEWTIELEEILEVAQVDSDQWCTMLAEMMKTLPSSGSLNTDIGDIIENKRIFTDLLNDLRKHVKKNADIGMLPLECHYLNKSALASVVGQQPPLIKHFSLKRKPKSAALRAELLQKSADAASNLKKSTAPTVPVRSRGMPRKMTDTTPLKGIPSRVRTAGFRSPALLSSPTISRPAMPRTPAGRKDGGIKLLDINEQPLGFAQAKKRKRLQELEDAKKTLDSPGQLPLQPNANANGTTPDYAAGLTTTNPPTPAPATPSYNPATPVAGTTPLRESGTPAETSSTISLPLLSPAQAVQNAITPSYVPQVTAASLAQSIQIPISTHSTTAQLSGSIAGPTTVTKQIIQLRPPASGTQMTQIRIQQITPAQPNGGTQRKHLSLTREQMVEAQEMFRTANRVTRPEKALILGFMGGSRDNPCPHLGNIVTIKLSESQENILQPDETYVMMTVETHFQMNYNTGEWKRIKKLKKLEDPTLVQSTPTAVQPVS